jgi:hypothetical protein
VSRISHLLLRLFPIERLLPHAFVGEKVPKADEGALGVAATLPNKSCAVTRRPESSSQSIAPHPSSGFATFCSEDRVGGGASQRDKYNVCAPLRGVVRCIENLSNHAHFQ